MMEHRSLLVVVPTRNRPDLALNAVRSVLDQQGCEGVLVLVSDNSTRAEDADRLSEGCRQLRDGRLRYIRPPQSLSMTQHWEWAMQQAMGLSAAGHFMYMTDRMVYKPGELRAVKEIAAAYPDKVISYNHDRVVDDVRPVRLEQCEWTGEVLEVESARLLALSSQLILHPALPRMLNCFAPRAVLDAIRRRFGAVFSSIAPDFSFCYRCLDTVESIIFYDRAPLLHYALERSNGQGMVRGVMSADHADFLASLGETRLNFAAPIPEMRTVCNTIVHEYCYARQETGGARFPEVDTGRYLQILSAEVARLEDEQLRREMEAVLAAHGGQSPDGAAAGSSPDGSGPGPLSPRRISNKIRWELRGAATKPLWLFLARAFRVRPPDDHRFAFETTEEALDYARRFPRRKSPRKDPHLNGRPLSLPKDS